MREKPVERVIAFGQLAFDMVHRMDEAGIHFYLPPPDHAHAARLANAGFVVSVHVRAHGELRRFLGRAQQRQNLLGIADRIRAARDRAGDGAGFDTPAIDPHIHLGRGRHQILTLAEVHERAVRCRVARPQPAEYFGGWRRAGLVKRLTGHDFEQIAALEGFARAAYTVCIFSGLMIAGARHLRHGLERRRIAGARHVLGGAPVRLELVADQRCQFAAVIDDEYFVRQIKHHVALFGCARKFLFNGIELKREVVAERAIKAQALILRR